MKGLKMSDNEELKKLIEDYDQIIKQLVEDEEQHYTDIAKEDRTKAINNIHDDVETLNNKWRVLRKRML